MKQPPYWKFTAFNNFHHKKNPYGLSVIHLTRPRARLFFFFPSRSARTRFLTRSCHDHR